MKIILFIILSVAVSISANNIFAKDTLKVVTYNIEGMKPGTDADNRIKHIIEELIKLNPDVITLQEVNEKLDGANNQGQKIVNSLSTHFQIQYYYYQAFAHLAWGNKYKELVGIISKYPVLNQGNKRLSKGMFYRQVIWNYIKTPFGMVNLFSTHLSFSSDSVRIKQVNEIKKYITKQEIDHSTTATILTGDFNDTPNSLPISLLVNPDSGTSYIDSFAKVNPNVTGNTIPSSKPEAKIDYIFYKNYEKIKPISSKIIMNKPYSNNNYNSDHFGVMTVFLLGD